MNMEMEMEMEMRSQQFGHIHPMVFNEMLNNQTIGATCSRCGEMVSESSFSCAECEFYLHKKCAEAPSEIDHPFHRNHPLVLVPPPPKSYKGRRTCNFCGETCEKFVYQCSCRLHLHIKCALFSLNIAEKKLGELQHIGFKVPSLSAEDDKKAKCFACWEPLLGSMHFSLDCGFSLHEKCVELPHEINYPIHKKHPLILQFNVQNLSCNFCRQRSAKKGFIYSCSPCKFSLHIKCAELPSILDLPCHRINPFVLQFNRKNKGISCKICKATRNDKYFYYCSSSDFFLHFECASPPLTIKEKIHEHPFTLFWRPASFICDACGLEGNFLSYTCSTCSLLVHKDCISLPSIIKVPRHEHPIFHNYFLHGFRKSEYCKICYEKVQIEYGSYSCFDCKFIVHVKCALEKEGLYQVIEAKDKDDLAMVPKMSSKPILCVLEQNEDGEMTKIRHFSHVHDLMLRDNLTEEYRDGGNLMEKYCDGCVLPISDPFYYCSECDFLLHKACAELPQKKHLWFHICQRLLNLVVPHIFKCGLCQSECNGFSYRCKECDVDYCLLCATGSYTIKHPGHEHRLFYDRNRKAWCSACGVKRLGLFKCKSCAFNLHIKCLGLPLTTWHKCDEHLLALTYEEVNKYSEYQYCDICEQRRDPRYWFYHCATCDVTAHPDCALGKYPFIKPGSIYKELQDHPHALTFVKKIFSGPRCHKCGQHCRDLVLECAESGCNYIVHWECAKPAYLRIRETAGYKTETDEIVPDTGSRRATGTDTDTSCIIL